MRNYNPWGRGGGGAPLKDAEGNLISMFVKIMSFSRLMFSCYCKGSIQLYYSLFCNTGSP